MVRRKRKNKNRGRLAAIIATVIVAFGAVLVFLYRDKLFSSGGFADAENAGSLDPYSYEFGAKQQFALMGNQLAVSSSTGLQLLDKDGYTQLRQVFSMKNPAIASTEKYCLFYDVGSRALHFYSGGKIIEPGLTGDIISASISSGGYAAVSCEESGYKGAVTVYNEKGEAVYKWYSGAGYVLDASVSPNGANLAVLTLEATGGVIHLFETRSENETATVFLPGELSFKLSFTANDSFCVLSETALRFYKAGGAALNALEFDGMTLCSYYLSEGFCAVALSQYVSGSAVTLTGFNADGKRLGSAELSYSPLALSYSKDKLMVLGLGSVSIFSRDLSAVSETEVPAGYNSAVYLPDGDLLLLSSYHGEKFSVKSK